MTSLRGIDLNLLVALQALLRERGVTPAARAIGVSQPAMSHALAKLRDLLDDPLLVRVGRVMVLTERAETLIERVDSAVGSLEHLFGHRPRFDPSVSTRRFSLAATDYAQFVLLPPLDAAIQREAPGVSLAVKTVPRPQIAQALRTGDIDLAIFLLQAVAEDDELHRAELFRDRYVGLARKGHPRVRRTMSCEAYAELSHVLVAPRGIGGGIVDSALAERDLRRHIAVALPQFLVAPHVIVSSDHVATIAERVARPFTKLLPLRIFEPPVVLPPIVVGAVWHQRTSEEPAHQWLRATLERVAAAQPTARGAVSGRAGGRNGGRAR